MLIVLTAPPTLLLSATMNELARHCLSNNNEPTKLGDQLVGIDGVSLLNARSKDQFPGVSEAEAAVAKNPLLFVQQRVSNKQQRPITLRFQRST